MNLHKHHIIQKHMGGDNHPDNITPPISTQLHAALHKDLYEHYGQTQDFVAWKRLLGHSLNGIQFTDEVRAKMSAAKKGGKCSEETKRKMSISHIGKNTAKHSIERRKKNSESQKGKKLSKETCRKMSESLMNHEVSIETRKKIGNSQRNKILSEDDTREKISKSKSKFIIYNGKTQSYSAWAKEIGITKAALRYRLKSGWAIENVLMIPKYQRKIV